MKKRLIIGAVLSLACGLLALPGLGAAAEAVWAETEEKNMKAADSRTFKIYPNIEMREVRFKNRYGIEVAAHLYLPEDYESRKNAAIAVAGPFGAVKEQAAGLYAQELASMGFVGMAFDPSFCGESGGEVRNMASPEVFTEDYSAAVDYLGMLEFVERERIGALGICGLTGMAVTAAAADTRIKAVATVSMYDMSRDMNFGYEDYYTPEQRAKIRDYLSRQRWKDAESGTRAGGPHEIEFDAADEPITETGPVPQELPEDANPVLKRFFDYYAKRARHERAVNFVTSWPAVMPMSFISFPLMSNIKDLSPRPILIVAGENAHSRYYSEDAYNAASEPKELLIIPEADHVDLYDNFEKIPFAKLKAFFEKNL